MMQTFNTIQTIMRATYDAYPRLTRLCVQASSELSSRLTDAGIKNYVALGSLSCGADKIHEYEPLNFNGPKGWDGHAWCVINDGLIADITFLKSVRELPEHVVIDRAIKNMVTQKWLLFIRDGDTTSYGQLTYEQEAILPENRLSAAIEGLKAHNS